MGKQTELGGTTLQEVQQSDTRRDGVGNMLINNGYKSQPTLDDFQNESAATRMKTSNLASIYEELGRGQRNKKMTRKCSKCQISLIKEKRQKMYS